MAVSEIVSAEYVQLPVKRPGLFPGRPWTVYFARAVRADGRKIKQGMRSFRLKRDAVAWVFSVCPDCTNDIPF